MRFVAVAGRELRWKEITASLLVWYVYRNNVWDDKYSLNSIWQNVFTVTYVSGTMGFWVWIHIIMRLLLGDFKIYMEKITYIVYMIVSVGTLLIQSYFAKSLLLFPHIIFINNYFFGRGLREIEFCSILTMFILLWGSSKYYI